MKKLKNRLKALSIQNSAVCNCHKVKFWLYTGTVHWVFDTSHVCAFLDVLSVWRMRQLEENQKEDMGTSHVKASTFIYQAHGWLSSWRFYRQMFNLHFWMLECPLLKETSLSLNVSLDKERNKYIQGMVMCLGNEFILVKVISFVTEGVASFTCWNEYSLVLNLFESDLNFIVHWT